MLTFGAVVVLVELSVLRLLLPADQVVGQVAVGKRRRQPLDKQLGGGVGEGARLPGHGRLCGRTRVSSRQVDTTERPTVPRRQLTGRTSAHVDDVGLRPLDVFALHLQRDGLHEDGVLGPGLQLLQAHVGVAAAVLGQVHVHHVPAVGAAAVLPVKLGDVLERSGEDKPKRQKD